jgi:hypothetical protein
MRGLLFLTALFLVAIASASGLDDGVRGLQWQSAPSALGIYKVIEDRGDGKCYEKLDEDLDVANAAKLSHVTYCYYKDHLYAVVMDYDGYINFSALRRVLLEKYGKGMNQDPYAENNFWGDRQGATLSLLYNPESDKGTITYLYTPLTDEKTASRQGETKTDRSR